MKKVVTTTAFLLFTVLCFAQQLEPGLLGEYYRIGTLREFPELEPKQKPTLKRIDKKIDFPRSAKMAGVTFTNDFYVQWTGKIHIAVADEYTFSLESDDGSELFIYNRKVVNNAGAHSLSEVSGKVELPAGDHPITIKFFQGVGPVGCRLFWTSKAIAKQIVPATVLFHEAIVIPPKPEPGPGLIGDYYDMVWKLWDLPSFLEYEKPTVTRIEPLLAFPDLASFSLPQMTEHFYACWTGRLNVPRSGPYTLFIASDDGSRLFLDGKLLIDHNGHHKMIEKSGRAELTEGFHDLKIEYFQNEGYAGCTLWWEGPGFKKDIIPRAAFSH
jgi:hypothetical protein